MQAELILSERRVIAGNAFVEIVVWRLPLPLRGSRHHFKYRLALIVNGCCALRYDNELGKGDHKHMGKIEKPYIFTTPEALLDDFWKDVDTRRF
ncbi:MAG: hypothetical protein A2293_03205 [Elusimicrobia bacterium RIFOXYB2_FULL_49_7]|nr:MAG: hypothetical protein A2293_03205 [Elusimicrobia bacterium RIFOXYB2_FULL_49_7]